MVTERRTDTHVYFWGGHFSQWAPSVFRAEVLDAGEWLFANAEQYMMAGKAALFRDASAFKAIMKTADPRRIKDLGRQVRKFDEDTWKANAEQIVYAGNYAKFSQSGGYLHYLLGTEDRIIVEGSPYDRIWGVGISWSDPRIEDEANWRGENLLGKAIMRVRNELKPNI